MCVCVCACARARTRVCVCVCVCCVHQVDCYDKYVYNPLQNWLSPLVQRVPREVKVGDRKVTVFTANIVSWARTALVIPIACCLK